MTSVARKGLRIQIIGTSASGKTTMARKLAKELGLRHLEIDSWVHQPGWTTLPDEELRGRVREFCSGDNWVIDHNYSTVRDILDARLTHIVWLRYPRWFIMQRSIRRTLIRGMMRKELWNGNREKLSAIFSRDPEQNIILWAYTSHAKNLVRYEELLASLPQVTEIRIGSPFGASRRVLKLLTD